MYCYMFFLGGRAITYVEIFEHPEISTMMCLCNAALRGEATEMEREGGDELSVLYIPLSSPGPNTEYGMGEKEYVSRY